ncbi:MAG: hypothetical protein U5R31_09000 [Acidimicrobiia bacterium]|nr:hypothetical protein [Acidimicrobiia bacterium]
MGDDGLELAVGELEREVEVAAGGPRRRRPRRVLPRRRSGRRRGARPRSRWASGWADSPTRTGGAVQTCSSRSRVRARWAPRLSRARAWISSTMTVPTVERVARLRSAVTRR